MVRAFYEAAENESYDVCQQILDSNGKKFAALLLLEDDVKNLGIDSNGKTLLHWLAEVGNKEAYKKVLLSSREKFPKDNAGKTPEALAVHRKKFAMVKMISSLNE